MQYDNIYSDKIAFSNIKKRFYYYWVRVKFTMLKKRKSFAILFLLSRRITARSSTFWKLKWLPGVDAYRVNSAHSSDDRRLELLTNYVRPLFREKQCSRLWWRHSLALSKLCALKRL